MEHDKKQSLDDFELDRFFADARCETPLPSADFLARIEADADRLQPRVVVPPRVTKHGLWERLATWIGRVALPSGLAAAGLTGIWIGLSLGASDSTSSYSFYDSDLGMRIIYEFPVLAGIVPEG